MQNTISVEAKSSIDWECPLTGQRFSASQIAAWNEKRELVRLQCVAEYSSNPLYQAAAAHDPKYWNKFSTGQVHLYGEAT